MSGKKEVIEKLQREILSLQGYKAPVDAIIPDFGLKPITDAFPNQILPIGALHEFVINDPESAAASGGFLSGLLAVLAEKTRSCVWISKARTLFPMAIARYGLDPDRIIFIDVQTDKQVLWVTEEALKCSALAAVVAEIRDLDLNQSRRLQLACEHSQVTGFLMRTDPQRMASSICAARWQITPLPSEQRRKKPGVGFPRWNVELLRVRNGLTGSWRVEWQVERFAVIFPSKQDTAEIIQQRNAG